MGSMFSKPRIKAELDSQLEANNLLTEFTALEAECQTLLDKVNKERKDGSTSNTVTMETDLENLTKHMSEFRVKNLQQKTHSEQHEPMQQSVQPTSSSSHPKSVSSFFSVSVQLYCYRSDQPIQPVLSGFEEKLTAQFHGRNTGVMFKQLDDPSNIDSELPVLVICINTSRLGSDAETALQRIMLSRKIALVIIHLKDTNALSREPSVEVLQEFNFNQGEIFDMAFLDDSRFYDCEMNTKALNGIAKFITDNN